MVSRVVAEELCRPRVFRVRTGHQQRGEQAPKRFFRMIRRPQILGRSPNAATGFGGRSNLKPERINMRPLVFSRQAIPPGDGRWSGLPQFPLTPSPIPPQDAMVSAEGGSRLRNCSHCLAAFLFTCLRQALQPRLDRVECSITRWRWCCGWGRVSV